MDTQAKASGETATLNRQARNYRKLLDLQRTLGSVRELSLLPSFLMGELSPLFAAERSTLYLFDAASMSFKAVFAEGVSAESVSIDLTMGLVGAAILSRQPINVANAYEHPFFNARIDAVSGYRTESVLVVPFVDASGCVVGAVELLNKHSGRFTGADEDRLRAAAAEWLATIGAGMAPDRPAAAVWVGELKANFACERGSVFLLDQVNAELFSLHADGAKDVDIRLSMRLGIAGFAAITGQTINVPDVTADPRFDASFDQRTGFHTLSALCQPMKTQTGEVLGVLQIINKRDGCFDEEDEQLLAGVGNIAAIAIESAMLFADQDKQFHSLLAALAASIDAKDALTAGHSTRVAEFAAGIGAALGFGPAELEVLQVAAILHDYGKIGVDDHVLKKPGKLDEEEYRHIKQHAGWTFNILDKIHFARKYRSVPLVASSHHESLDGSGYPRGLLAKDIPFMAKILTVADVFEALTADRHYRKGMTEVAAWAILDAGIGSKFDGNVVAALKKSRERSDRNPAATS